MPLRIRLLGRPDLERDGARVRLEGRKTWALLALVLLESPAPSRRRAVDRLFSNADDPQGALRWALSQVRKALAPEATIEERDDRLTVVGSFSVDARDVLQGVWDDHTIDDVARGELLEGVDDLDQPEFDRWLSIQRARLATARVDALRSCAASLVHGDALRALQLAEQALAAEPFDDALHELVVECHRARGDMDRARRYIERTEELYRRELGARAPVGLRRALERPAPEDGVPLLRIDLEARALLDAARARAVAGAFDDTLRDMTMRAINGAAASGDRALEVRAIVSFLNIRTCQMSRGRAEWDPLLQRAYMLATDLADASLLCDVEIERGRLAAIEGRFGTAEASLRRGLANARDLQDDRRIAIARRLLGTCETERCDYIAAEDDLRAALDHPEARHPALAYLSRLLVRAERYEDAEDVASESAAATAAGAFVWAPLAVIQLGELRLLRGDVAGAAERFASALAIARQTGDIDWLALSLRGLAHVDWREGRRERALVTLKSALDVANTRPGCRRWCEGMVLTDLVEWEDGRDPAHVVRALQLTRSAPMPDLAARLVRFADARPSQTLTHTVAR